MELREGLRLLGDLEGELAGRGEDERADGGRGRVVAAAEEVLDGRDEERQGLRGVRGGGDGNCVR